MPDTTPPPAPSAASTPSSPPPAETKGFACQWEGCDKSLPDPEVLYIHLCNDHIGRKSTNNLCLTCKWKGCGATCAKRDHITSHLRVHTPLKPHVCEICNKPFKRPQDLKKHEKIHTEEHHMAHRHSKAITVHDENYIERVRAQAPNAAAPPRGLDLNSLHPSLAGLGLPGHNLAYLAGATATREQARSPTLASFAGVQHHNQYGPGLGEFGSVSPRSADEALTPASARISPMPPHADIGLGWDTPSLGKRGRNGSDPASPSDDFWSDAKKRRFQPTYDAQMAERLSTLSSLGFPPLGAAHPSLSLHPNAHSPPSTTGAVPPSLPIPDPRSAEELAQWNQYLVKLGEQVASSVYAHALGLAPPPPPPPQQYLDPTTLAQFGLAGMPGLLGLGLGLGGLPGLGMLGAGGLGGVDYNAIAAYQQAQAQALAVQSQIAAGLYPGLDLASLAAAAAANPANVAAAAAAASASHDHADAKHSASPPRRPASSSSRRSASASESDFEFDALRPSRAPVSASGIPGLAGLPGFGAAGVSMGLGDKRSVVPLKSAPPPVKEEDEDADMDDADTTRFPPPAAPVEPRLGMRTPGMPAKIPATTGGSSGLYPTLPPSLASSSSSPSSSESSGEKIKLPGIQSLLEPSFRLRPVASSPSSSSENEDDDEDSNSTATSRAGSPSSQCGTVLPSFASIALSDSSRPVNKEVEERMRHIAVIQAMIVAVNKEWVAKHGPTQPLPPAEERKLEVSRDVEMVA